MPPIDAQATLSVNGQVLSLDTRGQSLLAIQINGTMSATLQLEATVDGTNWVSIFATPAGNNSLVSSFTAAGVWVANVSGFRAARLRCSAYTSGSPTMFLQANNEALPAGIIVPKYAKIVASSSGATEVVALVSGKKIRVLAYAVVANAAVNVKFQSHTAPTDLTGLLYNAANGGEICNYNPAGWFETLSGEALDINLSGAVAVGGHVTYMEI
jgi:hypothetical protein